MENRLVIGSETIPDAKVLEGDCVFGTSIAGDELSVDTGRFRVDGSVRRGMRFVPRGAKGYLTKEQRIFLVLPIINILVHDLGSHPYGTPVFYYHGNSLVGKFYLTAVRELDSLEIERTYKFEVTCVSAVGLLDGDDHYGGVYEGELMPDILTDIIGGMVPYTLDPIFEHVRVYGWLPKATRRANLHQLLYAEGATVKKDANGDMVITYLQSGAVTQIGDDRIFMGGTVSRDKLVDTVRVLEHSYIKDPNQAVSSLYEDYVPAKTIITPKGMSVSGTVVTFERPMFDLAIVDGEILEQGANYAVLQAGPLCKLSGKAYAHTTRENIETKPATRSLVNVVNNVATVENATLVSLVNGENVAKRALAYYGYASTVSADLSVLSERPGAGVSFRSRTGFIQTMDIALSGSLRATTELVCNFVPPPPGNFYNHSVVLTGAGTWSPPTGVTKIKAVIIGGGQGGESGENGADGSNGAQENSSKMSDEWEQNRLDQHYGLGGLGGKSGNGGEPGRILEIELSVTPETPLVYAAGVGGSGGAIGHKVQGALGTDTIFHDRSSVDGAIYPSGYLDLFSGVIYGGNGRKNGITGGDGSGGDGEKSYQYKAAAPVVDETGKVWTAGEKGADSFSDSSLAFKYTASVGVSGGPGGGSAVGCNGQGGGPGSSYIGESPTEARCSGTAGSAGDGATPIARGKQNVYGSGGDGGHGGGGGGGGGAGTITYSRYTNPPFTVNAALEARPAGKGGNGGAGGDGGDGCIIVYY